MAPSQDAIVGNKGFGIGIDPWKMSCHPGDDWHTGWWIQLIPDTSFLLSMFAWFLPVKMEGRTFGGCWRRYNRFSCKE